MAAMSHVWASITDKEPKNRYFLKSRFLIRHDSGVKIVIYDPELVVIDSGKTYERANRRTQRTFERKWNTVGGPIKKHASFSVLRLNVS